MRYFYKDRHLQPSIFYFTMPPPKARRAPKRQPPRAAKHTGTQPELDDILGEVFDVPDIDEYLGASLQRAFDCIKSVSEHRERLKERLKPCFTTKKVRSLSSMS